MKRLQISTGRPPPVVFLVDELSSLPSQTRGDQVRRVADEPGVAEILRRPGLAGGRPAREVGLGGGAADQRLPQHGVHHGDVALVDDAAEPGGVAAVERLAVERAHALDHVRRDRHAAVGERRKRPTRARSPRLPTCRARSRRWERAATRCRGDARCARPPSGVTSSVRRTDTVFSECARAWVEAHRPEILRACSSPAASPSRRSAGRRGSCRA